MNIFDLNNNDKNRELFSEYFNDNIKILLNTFGTEFILKLKNIEIPVVMLEQTGKFSDNKYWYIKYSIWDRDQYLLPLKINLCNPFTYKTDGVTYIANITKLHNVSGTNMMNIALKLLEILKSTKTYVWDAATVSCGLETMDLSFFKLLEKGKTFYQRFGFRFTIENIDNLKFNFKDDSTLQKTIFEYIDKLKKIKIEYIIKSYSIILSVLTNVINTQNYNKLNIYYYSPYEPYKTSKITKRKKVLDIINEIDIILKITNTSHNTYLYQDMIYYFYNDCKKYLDIMKYIIDNQIYMIKYDKKKYILKDVDIFYWINNMKQCFFVKDF
jgi:hypothetical protein